VAANGACPPEDCGDRWGYADLKAILADPAHDEHREMLEWLGLDNAGDFDPRAIATEDIDYELARGASRSPSASRGERVVACTTAAREAAAYHA